MAEAPATPAITAPVSLTSSAHKGLRIKNIGNADHIAPSHFAKIYTPEFAKAGTDYPIIFVRDPDTGTFFSAVMWGLEPGENLFVNEGRWEGDTFLLPFAVIRLPFSQIPKTRSACLLVFMKPPVSLTRKKAI